jgi:hypothetical protein
MGTYSFFESSSGDCEVDWDAMDTEVLFEFKYFEYAHKEKLKLCSEVGARMRETKLFGYINQGYVDAFHEFSMHLVPNGENPVWVYSYEGDSKRYTVRFFPGKEQVEFLCGEWM